MQVHFKISIAWPTLMTVNKTKADQSAGTPRGTQGSVYLPESLSDCASMPATPPVSARY